MSEFDGITGFDGWSKKLEELIAEAKESADLGVAERVAFNDRCAEFIVKSRPNIPEILELDAIAERTSDALMKAMLDERLASLSSRRMELAHLTKRLESQAAANEEAAKAIKLENILGVVDSLTESVQALQKLKDSVEEADAVEIESAIKSVTKLIGKFKAKVG